MFIYDIKKKILGILKFIGQFILCITPDSKSGQSFT